MESKLVFEEEYEVLRKAIVSKDGPETYINKMVNGKVSSEDLFDLIGSVAIINGKAFKTIKLNGNLSKLPVGGRSMLSGSGWKSRYFRLDGVSLTYFSKHTDKKPKGQIVLSGEAHIRDGENDSEFDIFTKNGTICLRASSWLGKLAWVSAIARAIHNARIESRTIGTFQINRQGKVVELDEEVRTLSRQWSSTVSATYKSRGHLTKLAVGSRRNWKNRYFVLFRNLFSYFESENDKKPKYNFILDASSKISIGLPADVSVPLPTERRNDETDTTVFHITFGHMFRPLILLASTVAERDEWIEALEYALGSSDVQEVQTNSFLKQDLLEIEVIFTKKSETGSSASSEGMLILTRSDNLVSIRSKIYQQWDEADIPLSFSFLLNKDTENRGAISKSLVDRVLSGNYTKVAKKQEAYFGVDKLLEDNHTLVVFVEPLEGPLDALMQSNPPDLPLPPIPTSSRKKSSEVDTGVFENEIRKLKSQLAEARNTIMMLQSSGSSVETSGGRLLSPLESCLLLLQRDGYIQEDLSTRKLARHFQNLFVQGDISSILMATGGPFEPLFRRYCQEPRHVRVFLQAIEDMLKLYTIPKTRMQEPWWRRVLKDPNFLKLDSQGMLKWAEDEPWVSTLALYNDCI